MKQTFLWDVLYSHSTQASPNVAAVTFGDGYEQARPKGLNHNLLSYSVTKNGRKEDIDDVDRFLTEHGGYKAFWWYSPTKYHDVLVKCRSWSRTGNGRNASIQMTFEEVVA